MIQSFVSAWPAPLGELVTPAAWRARATLETELAWSEEVKNAVRSLLRTDRFKPNGRNKPCNEYIRSAVQRDRFPWINAAVDATNLAVLHGGLPVSTVDLDVLTEPLHIGLAEGSYVFNTGGQEISVAGLLCLHDAHGPCSNAVKDSQRAKTTPDTTRTLTIIWGTDALPGRTEAVLALHQRDNRALGATVQPYSGL